MLRLISCVLLMLACSGGSRRESGPPKPIDPDRLLALVPTDTPYLIAALDPGPRPMKQFMQKGVERTVAQFLASTAALTTDARRTLDPWTRFRLALVDDLRGKPASELWNKLGIDVGAPFVLYGLGPWPVFRVAVQDPARLRTALEHALLQTSAKPNRVAGRQAWSLAFGDFELLLAIVDREGADPAQLVLAMSPASAKERVLTPPPRGGLLASKGLSELATRHKLSSRVMQGFVDLRRAVAVLQSTSLDDSIRRAIAPVISACGTELDRVAAAFPRVVFGYRAIDDVHFDATAVLEAPANVTTGLANLRTKVPGVVASHTTGALFSAGAAIDLDKFGAWAGGIVRDLRAKPFACPLLTWINDASSFLDEMLTSPLMGFIRGFRGSTFTLESVDVDTKAITGDVLLVGDQLAGLVAMATSFIPQLSGISIKPDGEPVELPAMAPWVTAAHIALQDDRLALAVGAQSHDRVRARLAVKAPPHSPLATFSGNATRFQKALEKLGQVDPDATPDDDIGDFAFHLDVTDAGIAIDLVGSW